MVTPFETAPATAALIAEDFAPPRDMFATAGFWALLATQSIPAMTPDQEPDPAQSSTRTGTSVTCLATPHVVPPTVPATCVPWPWQSSVPRPSLMDVMP